MAAADMMVSDVQPEHRLTILIVEDEILVRMTAAEFLRDCGYRVLEASNSAEAQLLLLADEAIDLVFSDVTMPGDMNGAALAKWIKQRTPDIFVILTTGGTNRTVGEDTFTSDILFVSKPYSLDRLADQINQLLAPKSS